MYLDKVYLGCVRMIDCINCSSKGNCVCVRVFVVCGLIWECVFVWM